MDGATGPAKQGESKELARPRASQDLQILVLWICWSLVTVRLTKCTSYCSINVSFLCAYFVDKLLAPSPTGVSWPFCSGHTSFADFGVVDMLVTHDCEAD